MIVLDFETIEPNDVSSFIEFLKLFNCSMNNYAYNIMILNDVDVVERVKAVIGVPYPVILKLELYKLVHRYFRPC